MYACVCVSYLSLFLSHTLLLLPLPRCDLPHSLSPLDISLQARQQQTLQRKLLERRQSQQSQQARLPLGAAGYSSSDGISTSAVPAAAARRVVPPSEATTPIAQSGAQRHVAATGRAGYSDAAAGSLLAGMMARAARKDNPGGNASGGPGMFDNLVDISCRGMLFSTIRLFVMCYHRSC